MHRSTRTQQAALRRSVLRSRSLTGLPVVFGGPVDAGGVLLTENSGAVRRPGPLGDRAVGQLARAAVELGRELTQQDAPADGLGSPGAAATRSGLHDILTELRELAPQVGDPALRAELLAACRRCDAAADHPDRLPATAPPLSPRELDVLGLAAAGCANGQIAGLLTMSVTAVKSQLRSAMRKLGVRSRHAAVSSARVNGLLA
jgi:DNA-binding CsgD family transcriptional regulator